MQDVHEILPIGTMVADRYNIIALLGKGGFGAVYLVRDQRVKGNLFALKEMIDTSKQERARFAFESDLLKRLDHPTLPRVYRTFEDEQHTRSYMLMDYIEGPNLEMLRKKQPQKRFSLAQVMSIMAPIIEAVSYLHKQNPPIIHRDIKPANIIVPTTDDQTVLVDFGIAKEFDPDSTTTSIRRCSPGYGAPEQYLRGTNTRTDIYGLGATFYTLLTGTVPDDAFYRMTNIGGGKGDPLEPVNQLIPNIPDAVSVVSVVSAAIQRAMALNIEDRFPTVEQFWQALNAAPLQQNTPIPPILAPVTPAPAAPVATPLLLAANQAYSSLTTQQQESTERARKRPLMPILLALLALALVTSLAATFWATTANRHVNPTTPVTVHKVTPAAKPTLATTQTAARPTPTIKPTNTPVPPSPYPNVAGTHNGTAHNTTGNIYANITVALNQNQGNIGGNVTINSPLQGSGPIINGFVQKNNYIQFTVQGYNGNAPLLFTGNIQPGGSISGAYCSIDQTGHCNPAVGGQGNWTVGAAINASSSLAPPNSPTSQLRQHTSPNPLIG
ncbi:MAG TPA: serine/threonine-protein kinase [Ktedonobacteraceae bacterium]